MQTNTAITVVLGTRPELIKLAPIINILAQTPGCELRLIFTNQHRELLAGLADLFELPPSVQLNVANQSPNLSQLTAQLISALDQDLAAHKPCDALIVQGDTTTALAASMVGLYQGISIAHVEAGLRTGDMSQPFPEEFNRQVISKISKWHFCPTEGAAENLIAEKIPRDQIHVVGNTVVDALTFVRNRKISALYQTIDLVQESPELHAALEKIDSMENATLSLFTVHRRESQGADQEDIFMALRKFAESHPRHHIIYPYHLNPKVKAPAFKILSRVSNVHLVPPLSYRPMIYLLSKVDFAVSDSGGIQEEIPSFRKPLLILRQRTERPEVITSGFAQMIGHDTVKLELLMDELVATAEGGEFPSWFKPQPGNPFGDGFAAARICNTLFESLKLFQDLQSLKAA